jgi:hypothetical protein
MTMTMPPAGGLRGAPGTVPPAWAAAAKAKLERDRKSYAAFRAADQQAHEQAWKQRHDAAVAGAEENARLFRGDIEVLEPDAAEALEASRAAEDRARDAREYARRQEAEAGRIRETGTAEEATDAQVRADTADGIAAEREAEAAKAREHLDGLERDLREAREGLEHAEHAVRAARKAAGVPAGTAPVSDATIRFNCAFMQADEVWNELTDRDKFRVRDAGEPRPMRDPREFWAELRAALKGEEATV